MRKITDIILGVVLLVIATNAISYNIGAKSIKQQKPTGQTLEQAKNEPAAIPSVTPTGETIVLSDGVYTLEEARKKVSGQTWCRERIMIEMHEMANSKIIANGNLIYGTHEITPELCDSMIRAINLSQQFNDEVRTKYINMLKEWKSGNYSNMVEEHNGLLMESDTPDGKAIGLKPEVKQEMVKKGFIKE